MCRKSIFVSFRNERLRMTTHWPRYIYREDVLRRAWWLHTILVVIWGIESRNVVIGGWVDFWHSLRSNRKYSYRQSSVLILLAKRTRKQAPCWCTTCSSVVPMVVLGSCPSMTMAPTVLGPVPNVVGPLPTVMMLLGIAVVTCPN